MKRTTVDAIVIVCMMIVLYINLTDIPAPKREVRGPLIKIGVE